MSSARSIGAVTDNLVPLPGCSRGSPEPHGASHNDTIEVVLKIVERCNLVCPYCYFFFSGDDSFKRHPPTIPKGVLLDLVAFLRNAALSRGKKRIRIVLHGGEPLMLKKRVFREMCELFRTEVGSVCELDIGVQTNGVLIDPEWVEIFAEYDLRIGVSMDGPEHIHNLTRITKKGRGTYAETRRGWSLLLEAAEQGRISDPGIICVVSPEHSGTEIFKHYAIEMQAVGVDFLLPDITHDSPEATPEFVAGCGRFLVDVYNAWSKAGGRCRIRIIYEATGPMLNDEACRQSMTSKYDPFGSIVVSSSGEISPDDVLRGVDPEFRDTGLRLGMHGLHEVHQSPPWKTLARAQQQVPAECRDCIWLNACGGGLPQHRYSKAKSFDNPSVFCAALKQFHGHVASCLILSGSPVAEIERRMQMEWTAPDAFEIPDPVV